MKTQVNRLKMSSLPKIVCLKSFGNSCDNSYVQLLVILSCFFPYFVATASAGNKLSKY